ncbi:hypothetical protein HDU87_004961 [Geranomyces variabilis]|uniref:D-2-hydroxyglutarate dehydrogenase, mitochondrial n=1 Tax=Geranomyces variabilis TaxID=109894 RepID=A0AAD5THI0_9FUNG|nr:hypothetical protein HDU87_004961 [Geranomyces variabilis]
MPRLAALSTRLPLLRTAVAAASAIPRRRIVCLLPKRAFSLAPTARAAAAAQALTSAQYPTLRRNPDFKTLNDNDVAFFKSAIKSPAGVITADTPDELEPFNQDWMRRFKGQSTLVLRPSSTSEVSAVLKYCNDNNIAVVPQGGNTGLVGGSVPVHDEVVLSLQNMNQIREFDPVSGILTCDAGCVLEVLDNHLAQKGFIMPLDLGAKGSCQIGGNVATNAGGLRLLRYGSLHGTVLSMEVVMADGRIVECGKPLRKDNTGFDLKQLFIGSEGTLGVITSVSILTPRRSRAVNVAMLGVSSFDHLMEVFKQAKMDLNEILSAFEFFDRTCLNLVKRHIPNVRAPFDADTRFYVLIETSGSNKDHDDDKLSTFLEHVMTEGMVEDGALAQDATQAAGMWNIRETITESLAKEGGNYKYDLSVPVAQLYDVVEEMQKQLAERGLYAADGSATGAVKHVVGFGHMGDGNLHLNLTSTGWTTELTQAIEPPLYKSIQRRGGSISAEHGVGLMKAPYLSYSKSADFIDLMKSMKKLFDPKGILNPYKYFPPS